MKAPSQTFKRVSLYTLCIAELLTAPSSRVAAAQPAARSTVLSAQACALEHLQKAVSRFSGEQQAMVDAAHWFAGGSTDDDKPASVTNPVLPAHCVVTGVIGAHGGDPVTPAGPTQYGNHFRLRIPQYWNGRLFFQGGGGNNGIVGNAIGTLKDGQNALVQGYAVVAQDSGHTGRGAEFSLDRKAYTDFAYRGVHDVALISKAIVTAYAGRAPDYSYFVGCSNGGREAMVSAQRYADFDGVVAGAPGFAVYDQWQQNLAVLQIVSKVAAATAAAPVSAVPIDTSKAYSDEQLAWVAEHFKNKCDGLDGLVDGLMSNYAACKAGAEDTRQLLCKNDGGDSADARCLSTAQAAGLNSIYAIFLPGSIETNLRDTYLGKGGSPLPGNTLYGIMSNFYYMGYGFLGYPGVTGPANQPASYPDPVAYVAGFVSGIESAKLAQGRLDFHGANIDPRQPGPNFEAFKRRGGKLLIYTGAADPAVPVSSVMAFMDRFHARYRSAAANTARLFVIPGMNHCRGGTTADQFDQLAPLVTWVEQGVAPERINARALPGSIAGNTAAEKSMNLSRPLCVYPKYAKYSNGDPAAAGSFVCAAD